MISIRPSRNDRCSDLQRKKRRNKEERIEVQRFLKKSSVLVKNETKLAKYSEHTTKNDVLIGKERSLESLQRQSISLNSGLNVAQLSLKAKTFLYCKSTTKKKLIKM